MPGASGLYINCDKKGDSMPITTVTWLMTITLVGTDMLLNYFKNKMMNEPYRRLEYHVDSADK